MQAGHNIIETVVYSISVATGFTIAWLLWRDQGKIDLANVSDYLRGAAVSLVTAGILSLAFMGFKGMITL